MSKTFNPILLILAATILILQFFTFAGAQDIEVRIKISADSPSIAEIEGKFLSSKRRRNPRNLSFLTEYGGIGGLGDRISNLKLQNADGKTITNKRFIPGEYVADDDFTSWQYTVDLAPLKQASAAAHISWVKGNIGLLMLDDLLPQGSGERVSGRIKLNLPTGWHIFTTAQTTVSGDYDIREIQKASFLVGRDWRDVSVEHVKLLTSGAWQFTDEEASKMAAEIFDHYTKVFSAAPVQNAQIAIMKFPGDVSIGNWEADTRGNSITIASSDMPFKSQSSQRLHEQLRHEIFHLWFPNGVNLSGNYDWFYEGFALYQSLKLGVAVNRIRFDDYLDTLSRAYNLDSFPSQRMSLIEASKNRWSGANIQVYVRGMLVAFLCDLALMEASKGKTSTDDLVREIYQKYRGAIIATDGNTAILDAMRTHQELGFIAEHYISGADKLEWNALLAGAGIEAVTQNSATVLRVTTKPGGRQKDLLDKLGYNNWRKLTGNNR